MRLKYGLILLILLQGCTPQKIEKLEITSIGAVHLRSITAKTLSMDVEIFLRNPYFRTARVKKMSFDIGMGTGFFGKGYVHHPFEIESASTKALIVPVVVDCEKVAEKDYLILFSASVPYHFKGTLDLEKPMRADQVELDAKGSVKLPDTFQVFLEHKTVSSMISLESSNIRDLLDLIRKGKIKLSIRNPFTFDIHANQIKYQVGLNRTAIANGGVQDSVTLHPGLNKVEVTASPRPLGAAGSVLQGILDRQIPDLSLNAHLSLIHENRRIDIEMNYSGQ